MSFLQPPVPHDDQMKAEAMDVVVRAILGSMPSEQLREAELLALRGLDLAAKDESLSPDDMVRLRGITKTVRFIFATVPNRT